MYTLSSAANPLMICFARKYRLHFQGKVNSVSDMRTDSSNTQTEESEMISFDPVDSPKFPVTARDVQIKAGYY